MKVFVFFLILAFVFGLWQVATRPERKAFRKAVRPFVLPAILALLVTIGVLAFAFNFNGKLI